MKNRFKKRAIRTVAAALLAVMVLAAFSGCIEQDNSRYLRVHIRANSNSQVDQAVKYAVKQAVTDYLTPLLAQFATDKQTATALVKSNAGAIKTVCDFALQTAGLSYKSDVKVQQEEFPLRSYGEYSFEEGIYDALIITLGSGTGDNWWCMVYPPLCFVGGEDDGSGTITYKSALLEIIQKFRKELAGT